MQELTLLDQQEQNSGGFVVITPQINYITALTPSPTPSPTSGNWISTSSIVTTQAQSALYHHQQYIHDSVYPLSNTIQSVPIAHQYYQSASESMSNQCEAHQNHSRNDVSNAKSGQKKKKSAKSAYKHVPHREKPFHLVARRNARERRRVQAVNSAFAKLRKCVPVENRNKRLSKVKTLHRAIEYIAALQQLLQDADESDELNDSNVNSHHISGCVKIENDVQKYNKENCNDDQKWLPIDEDCNHCADPYLSGYNCNYRYLKCLP